MTLLGKIDAALAGVTIVALGLASGWNLRHPSPWFEKLEQPFQVAKPVQPPRRQVTPDQFCVVRGMRVRCETNPPVWRE